MNKNIKIAKQLIKIAKQLIEDQKASNSQLNKLQDQMDDQTLKLFEQFKQEAEHRVIKLASEQSKAKSMIEQGILKSKSLSGKALKLFLFALVTFVSLHCNVAKADVIKLDNSNTLKQVAVNQDIKTENLDNFVNKLVQSMKKEDAVKFKKAVQDYKKKIGNKIKDMKIQKFIYQVQSKYSMTTIVENALFDSELNQAPIWSMNCIR